MTLSPITTALLFVTLTATPIPSPFPTVQHIQNQTPPSEISNQAPDHETTDAKPRPMANIAERTPPPTNTIHSHDDAESGNAESNEHLSWSWIATMWDWLCSIAGQTWFNLGMLVATMLIALFNCQLAGATRIMQQATQTAASVAESSHSLERQLFAITHRPWVHVRSVGAPTILNTEHIQISLTIVNRGGTPAQIISTSCSIVLDRDWDLPIGELPSVTYGLKHEPMRGLPLYLQPGVAYRVQKERHVEEWQTRDIENDPDNRWKMLSGQFRSGAAKLYVLGYIKYQDTFGLVHQTAFCRRYEPSKGGLFEVVNNPDFEYQE